MEDALQQLSLYLASRTVLGAGTCSYGLLALAAVFAAAFLHAAVSLRRQPLSFEKAQPPGESPGPVFFGRWLHDALQKAHFAIAGTTRSGKSLLLSLFLRSVIRQIRPDSDRRLLLFDPKNELHPLLFAGVQVPVHYVLPTDERASAWNLAVDFTGPAAAKQLSEALVPSKPNDSNPFFAESCQALVGGVITALNLSQPGQWSLADVVHILESRELTTQVLARYPQTRPLLRYMAEPRTWANIAATLESHLGSLRLIAALWSRAERGKTFSLKEFLDEKGMILVVGRDPKYSALLDPLNALLFSQLFSQLLAQPDDKTCRRRTHLVFDEFCVAAGEGKPLRGFGDICERGASRGVVVAVAYQSYSHVKALYQEAGDAFLGQLQNHIFLRCDPATAEFAAKAFAKVRKWIKTQSDTTSSGPHGTSSHATSDHYHVEDAVPPEKFMKLRLAAPEHGITGYSLSPPSDFDEQSFHLSGEWIAENLPKSDEQIEPYLMRPDHHQYLEPLGYKELRRLNLTLPEEQGEDDAAPPQTPLSPPRPTPAPRAADADSLGSLRRLIAGARGFGEGADDDNASQY